MKKLLLALALFFTLAGIAVATVNINTATKEELLTIKGIGEKRAQDIIDYRKKHGNFKSVDELEKVPGIGPGIMKQIRPGVSVTGKTTVAADTKSKAAEPAKAKEKSKAETKGGEKAAKKAADTKETKAATKVEKSKADEKKAPTK